MEVALEAQLSRDDLEDSDRALRVPGAGSGYRTGTLNHTRFPVDYIFNQGTILCFNNRSRASVVENKILRGSTSR